MFHFIPWDVRLASALSAVILCAKVFESLLSVFVLLYVMLCAYIVVSTFDEERS